MLEQILKDHTHYTVSDKYIIIYTINNCEECTCILQEANPVQIVKSTVDLKAFEKLQQLETVPEEGYYSVIDSICCSGCCEKLQKKEDEAAASYLEDEFASVHRIVNATFTGRIV